MDTSLLKGLSALQVVMCELARLEEDNLVHLQGFLLVPSAEERVVLWSSNTRVLVLIPPFESQMTLTKSCNLSQPKNRNSFTFSIWAVMSTKRENVHESICFLKCFYILPCAIDLQELRRYIRCKIAEIKKRE